MQVPDNLDQLIEQTPFGRVTVDIHRAYGQTQKVKARSRRQVKTETVDEVARVVGQHIGEMVLQGSSGRLEVAIALDKGRMKFTYIEAITD